MAKKTKVKRSVRQVSQKSSAVSEGLAIACLILNILILPGLGTLIGGKKQQGIWQLILLFGGIILGIILTITIIGAIVGIPILIGGPIAAWIWGIVSGVQIIKESSK